MVFHQLDLRKPGSAAILIAAPDEEYPRNPQGCKIFHCSQPKRRHRSQCISILDCTLFDIDLNDGVNFDVNPQFNSPSKTPDVEQSLVRIETFCNALIGF